MSRGSDAEALALAHLERSGLRCLLRNYRTRRGELDLVLLEGDTVVVVEVRARSHPGYGDALESVDRRKQQRLILAARQLLLERPDLGRRPLRFDVIGFDGGGKLTWIRDAFTASAD